MSFVDRLLARPQNLSLEDPAYPISEPTLLEALNVQPTYSSVHVTPEKSLGVSAVWRAVNVISYTSAMLPLHPYKNVDVPGFTTPARQVQGLGTAGGRLLADPNPTMTPVEFWALSYAHRALWGNFYAQVLRDRNGVIGELWPICPWNITPGRAKDGTKVYKWAGDEDPYFDAFTWNGPGQRRDIFHIPGFGFDGVAGVSPIAAHRQGIGLSMAAEESGARLFGSGTQASGILTTEQRLRPEQADALKQRWQSKVGGLRNAHQVAVLDAGAKFQQLTIPPADAQYIESRRFQVEEVARIYGVPPHMLMAVDKTTSWGAGIEEQTIGFVKFSLQGPWLTPTEQRVTKLIGPGTTYAMYNLDGLLRGDSAQRAAFYTQMFTIGAMSANEIRALEQLPPVEGGDVHYRPLNMGQLGTSDTAQTQTGDPANAQT